MEPTDTTIVSMAYYNRANAYVEKNEEDLAIKDYTKNIELDPNSANAYHDRGYAYSKKGTIYGQLKTITKLYRSNMTMFNSITIVV